MIFRDSCSGVATTGSKGRARSVIEQRFNHRANIPWRNNVERFDRLILVGMVENSLYRMELSIRESVVDLEG